MKTPIIFIDNPIETNKEDIIGLETYVDALKRAIDENAQMIAVTSMFGQGKSSVTKIFQKKYKDYEVISISMWSVLFGRPNDSFNPKNIKINSLFLHKSFLFHLLKEINSSKSEYFLKKLNKRYGNISLNIENSLFSGFIIIILSLLIVANLFNGYIFITKVINSIFSFAISEDLVKTVLNVLLVGLFLFFILKSEVIYSYKNQDSDTNIGEDEFIYLYNKYVLERNRIGNKFRDCKKYVVVIDDLDRIEQNYPPKSFLKELRKYYISNKKEGNNEVTFVVNISPEVNLCRDNKENSNEFLKLFDCIINIPKININDYRTILKEILLNKGKEISQYFDDDINDILEWNAWSWITKGKNVDIRVIKDRLNRSFISYSSLLEKFNPEETEIDFEKCTFAAYILTEFASDFLKTKDVFYSELIDKYIEGRSELIQHLSNLKDYTGDYLDEIKDAVVRKTIDKDYYKYFYDYPKNSKVYSANETIIENAILYNEDNSRIDRIIETENIDSAIADFIDHYKKFNKNVKDAVFKHEGLYKKYLVYDSVAIVDYLRNKISELRGKSEETVNFIIGLLQMDRQREVVSDEIIDSYCICLLELPDGDYESVRLKICELFHDEIRKYKRLFDDFCPLSKDECDCVSFKDALYLLSISGISKNLDLLDYFIERGIKEDNIKENQDSLQEILNGLINVISNSKLSKYMTKFMKDFGILVPSFEEVLCDVINSKENKELIDKLRDNYISIINKVCKLDSRNISEQTINNINNYKLIVGLDDDVIDLLFNKKQYFAFFLSVISSYNYDERISIDDIVHSVENEIVWLRNNIQVYKEVRNYILQCNPKIIDRYSFVYNSIPLDNSEIKLLDKTKNVSIKSILTMIPSDIVDSNNVDTIANILDNSNIRKKDLYEFFMYLTSFSSRYLIKFIHRLNFNVIRINNLSLYEKDIIYDRLNKVLNVGNNVNLMVEIMAYTKALYYKYEISIRDYLEKETSIIDGYISVINDCDLRTINKETINNLNVINKEITLNDAILEYLYKHKYYKEFIVFSTVRGTNIDSQLEENFDILYDYALVAIRENKYNKTIEYLGNYRKLIDRIIKNKQFYDLPDSFILFLSKGMQTDSLLDRIFTYNNDIIIKYLSKVSKIDSSSTEEVLLNRIIENEIVLKNKEVYENIYGILSKPKFRNKYTAKRNKANKNSL